MKTVSLLTALICTLSCHTAVKPGNKKDTNLAVISKQHPAYTIKYHNLLKLFIVGDFNGDGRPDTIYQHTISKLSRREIDSIGEPSTGDWFDYVNLFNQLQPDVCLTSSLHNTDTLHAGEGPGLLCLINIGDNNADGRDEIAYVVEYLDFSQTNTCEIYTLCNDKWKGIKWFFVHEDGFYGDSTKAPIKNEIKDWLEKRKGIWYYRDYREWMIGADGNSNNFKKLITEKCM